MKIKKWTALLLAGTMLLTGCSSRKSADSEQEPFGEAGTPVEMADTEKSMGRYLESEITLPEEVGTLAMYPMADMQMLDSGELLLVERVAGMYVSADKGETWEHKDVPWFTELAGNSYISQIALAPNGAVAVIHDPFDNEEESEETELSKTAAAEALGNTETASVESEYQPQYFYVDPDGNTKVLEYHDSENYLHQFWFGKDSKLYAYGLDHNVYEVNTEDGSMKFLFETEGLSDYVCFTEHYMIVFTSREVAIYDMEKGVLSDVDTVLQNFIADNIGDMIGSSSDRYSVVAVEGEQEDVLYFAFSSGLYRHVIGGTAMEQIVDGDISSLGDPMMGLRGIAIFPDNEFALLYDNTKLYRYVYDPNIPTVPDQQIGVYSLTENYSIRQAVSLFQKQNPEVYVRYEIGMSGEDGITSEDAIKNLNTRMMSDSGPDILVLDGLPADSYKEKGILADLSTVVDGMTGENSLFPNLVEACREDGKIYGLPVRFQIPMIVGKSDDIQNIKDLNTLADAVEKIRGSNPEGDILGLKTEQRILYTLAQVSSAAWLDDTKAIDKEVLTEFLSAAKRIYEAEIADIDPQMLEAYHETNWDTGFAGEGVYYATTSSNAIDIAMNMQKLAIGKVYRLDFDFNVITTLAKQEDFAYAFWEGQVAGGFIPNTTVGVYTKSTENELAMKFFHFLFERELQDVDLSGGFPMNQASFDTFAVNSRGDNAGGGIAISSESGDYFSLDIQWADVQDFERLKEMVQSVSKISTGDATIEQTVYEIGPKALNGKSSVEDTVDEIVKKAAIYLAE